MYLLKVKIHGCHMHGPLIASKVLIHVQMQNNYLVKIHGCHGPTIAGKVRIPFQMQNAY